VTRGADDLDQAAELTQTRVDDAVAAVRRKARPEQVQNLDGSWPSPLCVDCDDDIPPLRLSLGRIRCVYCQTAIEREARK
jgi:RNA polymerase-binding transcription factor DksA